MKNYFKTQPVWLALSIYVIAALLLLGLTAIAVFVIGYCIAGLWNLAVVPMGAQAMTWVQGSSLYALARIAVFAFTRPKNQEKKS
jgi:membrane protein implicated in regulation of membrane protease activity